MSISRRGLIAAGLAVAVVGAVGVASTLNAGAAQIAEPTTETASSAPVTDETTASTELVLPPPTELSGGSRPATKSKARAAFLSRRGAVAAVEPTEDEPEGDDTADPAFAPKGMPGFTVPKAKRALNGPSSVAALSTESSPAGVTAKSAAVAERKATYYYGTALQLADSDGANGYVTVGRPELSMGKPGDEDDDFHSLAEIAVRSTDGSNNIVEVGWTVDDVTNEASGDKRFEPHLFVYYWVDGVPKCYNTECPGWTQKHADFAPGMMLDAGSTRKMMIRHFSNAWWVGYEGKWMGYFDDSLWKGEFTRGGAVQWFGETAVLGNNSCTDMGNALPASEEKAASFSRLAIYDGPPVKTAFSATNSKLYSIQPAATTADPTAFRFGGPGSGECKSE